MQLCLLVQVSSRILFSRAHQFTAHIETFQMELEQTRERESETSLLDINTN